MNEVAKKCSTIVALRNEKGSYNARQVTNNSRHIVALRNEKGSYNQSHV